MGPETGAHFLFVGSGSEVPRVQAAIQDDGIGNVTLLPAVDQETYFAMLSEFDVGLVSLDRRLQTYSNTGKALGYMRCGLPILASVNPGNDLVDLLHSTGAGFASVNGEDDEFYWNALRLCQRDVRVAMSFESRKLLAQEFAAERAVQRILAMAYGEASPHSPEVSDAAVSAR
jgi:hypothetical protein